jgi:hypothetical protein
VPKRKLLSTSSLHVLQIVCFTSSHLQDLVFSRQRFHLITNMTLFVRRVAQAHWGIMWWLFNCCLYFGLANVPIFMVNNKINLCFNFELYFTWCRILTFVKNALLYFQSNLTTCITWLSIPVLLISSNRTFLSLWAKWL